MENGDHVCYQEKTIADMHKILVGNGDPSKSLVSQVLLINERQNEVLKILDEIKQTRKNTLPTILSIIGGISALVLIYFGYEDLKKQGREIKTETKVTNEILIPSQSRGEAYNPFEKDSTK